MANIFDIGCNYLDKFGCIIPVGAWSFIGRDGKEYGWKHSLIKEWSINPLRTKQDFYDTFNYWYQRQGAVPGIAIPTGQISGGYIVLDLDRDSDKGIDGYERLKEWERETGETLPDETWTGISGGGGYHFWYHTDKVIPGYSSKDGVDVRADGQYIVVPPSLHPSGNRYEWEYSPREYECAEATEAVYHFIDAFRPGGSESETGERKGLLIGEIPEGARTDTLVRFIGTLSRLGCADDTIRGAVASENYLKCVPPLTTEELDKEVFPSLKRFTKGVDSTKWMDPEEYKRQKRMKWRNQDLLNRLQKMEQYEEV